MIVGAVAPLTERICKELRMKFNSQFLAPGLGLMGSVLLVKELEWGVVISNQSGRGGGLQLR